MRDECETERSSSEFEVPLQKSFKCTNRDHKEKITMLPYAVVKIKEKEKRDVSLLRDTSLVALASQLFNANIIRYKTLRHADSRPKQ